MTLLRKLEGVFRKTASEYENQQELVLEIDSNFSEDENDNIKPNRSVSQLMKETLGTLTKSHNSLQIDQNHFGQASILYTPVPILGGDILRKR